MLRDVAQGIADFIAGDEYLRERGHVSVVVEDKANFNFEIEQAIGSLGVCVTIAVADFRRVDRSPKLPKGLAGMVAAADDGSIQGTLKLEISCYEHPTLNRDDPSTLTAQGVMERLARILHYRRFPFLANQLLFQSFRRDDIDEANVLRGDFEVNTLLGYEDEWAASKNNNLQQQEGE